MRQTLFLFFKKFASLISGRGLARVPFAVPFYQTIYRHLKPDGIISVSAQGHTFFVNTRDTGIAPPLLMHGIFAPGETAALAKLLKPGGVFVDVGANIGYFSLLAARIVGPEGAVYAFEPECENYELLERNIRANGYRNIIPVKQAVSDRVGETTLYLCEDNLCAHSLVPRKGGGAVTVPTTTLDEYFKNKRVDVVKIDVEGAEPAVLKGAWALIEAHKDVTLVIEFYPKAFRRYGADPERFLTDLSNRGFTLYAISETPGVEPREIRRSEFSALAKGEGIAKLVNLLCVSD